MSFQQAQLAKSINQSQGIFDEFIYRPTNDDTLEDIMVDNFFVKSRFIGTDGWEGGLLTVNVAGSLFQLVIKGSTAELIAGGSGAFSIGPTPNEFKSATLAGAIVLLDAQTLAFPDWVAFYDSAPMTSTSNAPLNVRVFYTDAGINYVQLMARDDGNWVINESFEGVQGDRGIDGLPGDGVTSSFKSQAELDSYYIADTRYTSLLADDNVTVTIDGVVFQMIWEGGDGPTSYDPLLWRRAEIGTTAGSLLMGPSSIESAAQVLMYKNATGKSNYIVQSEFDETGSKVPTYNEIGAEEIFDLALVDTEILTGVIKAETIMLFTSISDAFVMKPASEGKFKFNTWIGTEAGHGDQPILTESFTVTAGMVGNETLVSIKNPVIIPLGESVYTEITGIDMYGGLQTEGPMAGQTVPFNKLHLQKLTPKDIALKEEVTSIEVNTNAKPTLIEINTVIDGVTRTQNINKVNSTNAGLMTPSDSDKIDGIETGAQVNDNQAKVKTGGTAGYLADKMIAGINVTIDSTDEEIVINAAGGGGEIGDIEVLSISDEAIGFRTTSDIEYILPQVPFDGAGATGAPFFYDAPGPETNLTQQSVFTDALQMESFNIWNVEIPDDSIWTSLTVKPTPDLVGKKIKINFNYRDKSRALISNITEEKLVENTDDLTLKFNIPFSPLNNTLAMDVDVITSPLAATDLLGDNAPFPKQPYWILNRVDTYSKTNLAISNEMLNILEPPLTYVQIVNGVIPGTVDVPAGVYEISYGCGFRAGTGIAVRWCQAELKIGGVSVTLVANGIANNASGANFCSVSETIRYTMATSGAIEVSLSASDVTSIDYRGFSMLVTKVG